MILREPRADKPNTGTVPEGFLKVTDILVKLWWLFIIIAFLYFTTIYCTELLFYFSVLLFFVTFVGVSMKDPHLVLMLLMVLCILSLQIKLP